MIDRLYYQPLYDFRIAEGYLGKPDTPEVINRKRYLEDLGFKCSIDGGKEATEYGRATVTRIIIENPDGLLVPEGAI
jgi:hypothetical protein